MILVLILEFIKCLVLGTIWGCGIYKLSRNNPEINVARISAVMFTVAALFNLLISIIVFAVLMCVANGKFKIRFFIKKEQDMIIESKMSNSELRGYQKKTTIKRVILYFTVAYCTMLFIAFSYGFCKGLVESLQEMQYYKYQLEQQYEQQQPKYEYL